MKQYVASNLKAQVLSLDPCSTKLTGTVVVTWTFHLGTPLETPGKARLVASNLAIPASSRGLRSKSEMHLEGASIPKV